MEQSKGTRESMDRTIEHFDSKFRFVLLAARRAEQLVRGARAKLDLTREKPVRLAMEEVQSGLVDWDYGPAPEAEAPPAAEGEKGLEDAGQEAAGEPEAH